MREDHWVHVAVAVVEVEEFIHAGADFAEGRDGRRRVIEITGNLWSYLDRPNYNLCITTNGMVKRNGHGVMGRGCAREALDRFPELGLILGKAIRANGNVVQVLSSHHRIWSFPVKHDWREEADLVLIARSTAKLKELAETSGDYDDCRWVLPRPGCGNGRLVWEDVKPIVSTLPDNVLVITR